MRARAGRPTAARRDPTPPRRRGSRRRACAGRRRASPRRRGSARRRCPPTRCARRAATRRSRKTRVARARRGAARRTRCRSVSGGSSGRRARKTGSCTFPPFELALVHEPRAGLGQRRDGRRARLLGRERRGRTGLVVVLDEADEPLLVAVLGRQVAAHRLGARRARAGRRGACRSSSRSPAAGAPTRGPSRPRP